MKPGYQPKETGKPRGEPPQCGSSVMPPIEGELGTRIQAALDKFVKERKRRMFIDGEVVIVEGQFVDPERVTVGESNEPT